MVEKNAKEVEVDKVVEEVEEKKKKVQEKV